MGAALSAFVLVQGNWSLALKVHPVVQDAHDFDRALRRRAVHQDVTSATTAARDVQRTETGQNLVSGPRACKVRTIGKLANRPDERIAVDARLPRAEFLRGPFDDVREVELSGSAETDAPSLLGHAGFIRRFWK